MDVHDPGQRRKQKEGLAIIPQVQYFDRGKRKMHLFKRYVKVLFQILSSMWREMVEVRKEREKDWNINKWSGKGAYLKILYNILNCTSIVMRRGRIFSYDPNLSGIQEIHTSLSLVFQQYNSRFLTNVKIEWN